MSTVPFRAVHESPTAGSTDCDDTSRAASRALHPAATGQHPAVPATGPATTDTNVTPLDTAVLDDIAAGLASVAASTGPVAPWEVRTTPLLATAAYDAYLMEWGPAAMSDTHDHDGSVGVVHVVDGSLLESSQSLESQVPAPVRRLDRGDSTQIAAAQFHRLFNRSTDTAVTVHVFSPPIGEH